MRIFSRSSDTTEAERHSERVELARAQRLRFANAAGVEELDRADLAFGRHWVVHEPTGRRYFVYRGSIEGGPHHPVSAYYAAGDGDVVFLERLAEKWSKPPARR